MRNTHFEVAGVQTASHWRPVSHALIAALYLVTFGSTLERLVPSNNLKLKAASHWWPFSHALIAAV